MTNSLMDWPLLRRNWWLEIPWTPPRRWDHSWQNVNAEALRSTSILASPKGPRIVTGGGRPPGLDRGWYVEPTVMTNVDNGTRVARRGGFGPLLTVTAFKDQEEAIKLANDSTYGLSGAVYTSDSERARSVVAAVRTGAMGINGSSMNHIAPMGGVKSSGIGRKGGPEGLASFFELKSVHNPGLIT